MRPRLPEQGPTELHTTTTAFEKGSLTTRVEAIAIRLEAIATRVEAITTRVEAIGSVTTPAGPRAVIFVQ